MPHETCAHCRTPIQDRSTRAESGGAVYCCRNCATAAEGSPREAERRCAHCETPITDPSTMVVNGDLAYCCRNCQMAVTADAPMSHHG